MNQVKKNMATKHPKKNHQRTEKVPNLQSPIRRRILNAASKIMNEKGSDVTTISEIAFETGVKDPVIYQYFKGKEDLLFSVVEGHMEKFLSFLDEQLQGILGAHNKLRKLTWAHLYFNDVNREYITLVILECRTNRSFYKSQAYKLIRQYVGILMAILQEGVEEGVFTPDVDLCLVRDLILGLVDFEAITCLITHEIPEAAPDHEDCMRLIQRMLLVNSGDKHSSVNKKQRILLAAMKAFAEKGYEKATISEIASSAGIGEGTVYEYFKNKDDLLLSIPEERFQEHLDSLSETFDIRDPFRKVRRFIQYHFKLYLIDQDFLKVCLMLIILNRRFYVSRAYESLRKYLQVLEKILQEGIDQGCFTQDTNIRVFRNMFMGSFTHMVLRWLFFDKNVDKMDEINGITALLNKALYDTAGCGKAYQIIKK